MARHRIRTSSRFYRQIDRSGDCWLWTGARNDAGYGAMSVDSRTMGAHRVSWVLHRGPLAKGERVAHLCGNRACVRPEHLLGPEDGEGERRVAAGSPSASAQG